ncbi:interleukin 3 precursor [Gallus gallus]|uniref:Interleukin-3 n=4 Tax=Gallus TaxID=9030 RepID=Q5W4T9_CHICK|nr:interleukin 3 precursor [Gallus gallus]ACR08090.1 interleukin 3 [Gallus lafayettii]ACR08112.1 interleukin 3 [Gallus varius]ACR08114.1 interleukin 3 [Gallus sonneratii]ACR08091.1 interleukin 3 [Gallus lafayettii]ACR08092.1 interleukin 3 [Gallus lafayettii]|eukprot:NP_001007084.1 interleukin 3 precursor [Gallus gallus]
MLLLLCLLLSCWAPSCPSPLPLDKDCPSTSSLSEVIEDVEKLQGSNEAIPPNNIILMMEQGEENAVTYLEEFIRALESSKKQIKKDFLRNLQKIYSTGKNCTGWLIHNWEPMESDDFFKNFEELLKFLNMYGVSKKTS